MKLVYAKDGPTLDIGLRGENNARRVVFDIEEWVEMYGVGRAELLYHRYGDAVPYPRQYTKQQNELYWTVTAWDTEFPGSDHECELRYYIGDTLVKSNTWRVVVRQALDEPDQSDPPDPFESWVSEVLKAAASIEGTADTSNAAVEEAKAHADRAEAGADFVGTKAAEVNEALIMAQFAAGGAMHSQQAAEKAAETAEENVQDALQAAKDSGEFDGFTPTVELSETEEGTVITVTNQDGQQSTVVKGGTVEVDETMSVSGMAADAKVVGDRLSDVEKDIADLLYQPIQISRFKTNLGTQELGAVVQSVTLSWALNKDPVTLALDGVALSNALRAKTLTGLTVTDVHNWTLVATDERGAKAEADATLNFENGIYYGVAAIPEEVNSAFILALSDKIVTGVKNQTVKVAAGAGQYVWYAYPARLGTSLFNIGGFDYEYDRAAVEVTNQYGYKESYYVYRSGQPVSETLTVTVKDGG